MISKWVATVKSKVMFLITAVLLVGFTFLISYFLNKAISFEDTKYFGEFFWWVRVGVAVLFLACAVYVALSKKDGISKFYYLLTSACLQVLPLIVRFIGLIDNEKVAVEISVLILAVCLIPYLIFVFYLTMASDKIRRARKATRASSIKVVDDGDYYDDNGNFVGSKKTKK